MNALCWTYIRTKTRDAMAEGMQDVLGETVKLTPGSPTVVLRGGESEESLWNYIQNMARHSMLAGVGDALGISAEIPDNTQELRENWPGESRSEGEPIR